MRRISRDAELDRWVVSQRAARNSLDPFVPYAFHIEEELAADGCTIESATVFLTNTECPYRCVMCDLWRNTLDPEVTPRTPPGAIPAQIDTANQALGDRWKRSRRQIKLYNAGSFFDSRAIPPSDYSAILDRVRDFERVIVECHPALIGPRVLPFRDGLRGRLEVAIGLETSHAEALAALNKRMTLESFRRAAGFLREHDIDLRVFLLVHPPFVAPSSARKWLERSLREAFACGATACSLIPLRLGNGAVDELAAAGRAGEPTLNELDWGLRAGLRIGQGRVFADLWDVDRFSCCELCRPEIVRRLQCMNATQRAAPAVRCRHHLTTDHSPQ